MFFFANKKVDLKKDSLRTIVGAMSKALTDPDIADLSDRKEVTDKQRQQYANLMEDLCRLDSRFKQFTPDSALAYRAGMLYGMALLGKITQTIDTKNASFEDDANTLLKEVITLYMTPFVALESVVDKWPDDRWFENLMANIKVSPEDTKEIKKTKKSKK